MTSGWSVFIRSTEVVCTDIHCDDSNTSFLRDTRCLWYTDLQPDHGLGCIQNLRCTKEPPQDFSSSCRCKEDRSQACCYCNLLHCSIHLLHCSNLHLHCSILHSHLQCIDSTCNTMLTSDCHSDISDLVFLPESQHCLALPWSYLQVEVSQLPNIKSPIHPNVFSSFPIAASDRVRRESNKIILKFVILRILCFTDDTLPTLFLMGIKLSNSFVVWVFQGNTILVKRAINKKKRNIEFPFLHIALKMKTFSMKTFSIQQWYRKNEIFFLSLFKSCLGQQWQWARSLKQWQGPACNDLGKLSSVWLILKHN